jgi:cation diffusion facilitator CzcD-associated flavoprotein CzcO
VSHVDVVIVGAGLSGVGTAVHLQRECPGRSYLVLEGRAAMGGTWDLFRYPGIRSDSDMYTLGYDFKPWLGRKAIADGDSIRAYIREAAAEYGVDRQVRYRQRVARATWSSAEAVWTVEAANDDTGEVTRHTCNVLLLCSGYYSYRAGHEPVFEGREKFRGRVVHPQHWPADLDWRGKRVVVIGSGATAMTLVPVLARDAAHVVMLQRSPTWVISRPAVDPIARTLGRLLPARWAYALVRWKNVRLHDLVYRRARSQPGRMKRFLLGQARRALGPDYDIATHFTPSYEPWDQRLCLVPDGDLFDAIRSGAASVATDRIEGFDESGIRLASGARVDADIIVTATGFELVTPGAAEFVVDGELVDFAKAWAYRGRMFSDVPNLVYTMGYFNASWTLRADLVARWTCRLLNHMTATGARKVTPRLREADRDMTPRPWTGTLKSSYIQRQIASLPRQGDREPWIVPERYLTERATILREPLEDGVLVFERGPAPRDSTAA